MIMHAPDGEELTCRAHEAEFDDGGAAVRRGVVSYYAAATLPEATTLQSWLDLIHETSREDVVKGRLNPFHQPTLQLTGDETMPLIGRPSTQGLSADESMPTEE